MVEPLPCHYEAEGGNQKDEEDWKRVPVQRYRQPPSLPNSLPQVPLRNRIEALDLEGEVGEDVVEGPPIYKLIFIVFSSGPLSSRTGN